MTTTILRTERPASATHDVRGIGSLLAVTIALVIAAIGFVINPETGWLPGVAGLPFVGTQAWRMSDEFVAARGKHELAVALWLGARTILLADAVVVAVLMAGTAVAGLGWVFEGHPLVHAPLYAIAGVVVLIAIGALYYLAGLAFIGLPISLIVFPAAIVWGLLFRALMRALERRDATVTAAARS